jgi:hypothetical protein
VVVSSSLSSLPKKPNHKERTKKRLSHFRAKVI